MYKKISVLALVLVLSASSLIFAQKSPRKQNSGEISGVKVDIDYGSPSVRGRTIYGGLEAYGKVWRAGANKNTTVTFSDNVKIGGKNLPKGKYGFFIIPNEKEDWVVIFNKKNEDWGAYSYKKEEDALRVNIKPTHVKENQETLMYEVKSNEILFAWEKVELHIPVTK